MWLNILLQRLAYIRLTLQFFCINWRTAVFLLFACSAFASDWTEKYLHRPADNLDLFPSFGSYKSSTRQLINLNGIWQAQKKGEKTWKKVWVPGAYDFEGEVEFKRFFELDSSIVGHSFKLVVFGINNRCTIFVNDEFLGGHIGGHVSFTIALESQNLTFGAQNEIRILVDNKLLPRNSLPLKHSPRTTRNYGGIFRDIFIVAVPQIFIDNLQVREMFTDDLKHCQLLIKALLKNRLKHNVKSEIDKKVFTFFVELWDANASQIMTKSPIESISFDSLVLQKDMILNVENVDLWNPEHPRLYELRAYLTQNKEILDQFSIKIGFNKINIDGNRFLLNGQHFKLLGIDWYEDFPKLGPTAGWNTIKNEFYQMKELGANAIRVVGTPPHPYLMDLCDELGILVFQEPPLNLIPEARFEDQTFTELTINYYQKMLERDTHHASLGGWGLGSDLQWQQTNTQRFLQNLKEVIQESSSRPTYTVVRYSQQIFWPSGADLVFLEFYNKESADILSFTNKWITKYPNQGFVFSFGYPLIKWEKNLLFPKFKDNNRTFTLSKNLVPVSNEFQEHQAYKLQQVFLNLELFSKSAGAFIYTFADWTEAQPNLIFGRNENTLINTSGVVDINREKRIAFDVIKSVFKAGQPQQRTPRMPAMQSPIVYTIGGLALILILLFNFNRSRRLRGNLRRIFLYPHGFYTELKEHRKISVWHTFLLGMITCTVLSIIISSFAFRFRQDLIFNEILNLFFRNEVIKLKLIWLIWNPLGFIIIVTGLFYLIFCLLILSLRITSYILGQSLPIGQFFTLVFWASANFLWLLPTTPIYSRIISRPNWIVPAICLLLLFILWYFVRIFRGLKVVFSLSYFKTGLLIVILFMILMGGLGWYYERNHALFDYFPLYWNFIVKSVI
ncbi:MAG: glycoside hydrolase family 2 TIM barrel-domain containing protein [bacterium]